MQAYFASQNQQINLRINPSLLPAPLDLSPSQHEHDISSLVREFDNKPPTPLQYPPVRKEKQSPSSVMFRLSNQTSPMVHNSHKHISQTSENTFSPNTEKMYTHAEAPTMHSLEPKSPFYHNSGSNTPRSVFGLAENYQREKLLDSMIPPPPLRTDDLTDEDLYTHPDLSKTKEYWQYIPPCRSPIRGLKISTPRAGGSSQYASLAGQCTTDYSPHDIVFQIQFKLGFRYFLPGTHSPKSFSLGDLVIAEADKGEDMGCIVEIMTMQGYVDKARAGNHSLDEEEYKLRQILRMASLHERNQLQRKYVDEQIVANYCADMVKNKYHLPMQIVTAEYQFDRSKLFIHYAANTRVDFRELIKNVFSTFKTCIWFKKINKKQCFEPKPFALVALRTGAI